MENADRGRLAKNVSVAGLLLGGIAICVAQGYSGYKALQTETVAPPIEAPSIIDIAKLKGEYTLAGEQAGVETPPAEMAPVKASTRWPKEHYRQSLARPAVWQPDKEVRHPYGPAAPFYRGPAPAFGPSGGSPAVPATWQRPAAPISGPRAPRVPARSGRVPSIAPGFEGKSCGMGLG